MATKEIWRRLRWYLIYLGPRRDVTIETLNGLLTFESKDWLIGKYLYINRSHETHEIFSAIDLLKTHGYLADSKKGKTVLNAGANIGMTSVGLVKAGGFDRAIAFEPAPTSYRLLLHNINQNGLRDKIRTFQLALSSCDGELELELSDSNSGDHRIRKTDGSGFFREEKRRTIKVRARTLDGLLREDATLRNEKVDLIWMDIQGHEGHLLRGARHFLRQKIPVVAEFWPYGIRRSGMSRTDFCEIIRGLFTRFYVLGDPSIKGFPASEIGVLFDAYSRPREMCLIVLVNERRSPYQGGSPYSRSAVFPSVSGN